MKYGCSRHQDDATVHLSGSSKERPAGAPLPSQEGTVLDRRLGIDRRAMQSAEEQATNLERRRGPGRRRTDFLKAADEGEMTQEQFLFLMAIDAFKRVNNKTFPSWTDVIEIIRKLGYRKTMPSSLNLGGRAEDWLERPDAPSNVTKVTESEAA